MTTPVRRSVPWMLLALLAATPARSQETTLVPFSLKDQFDQVHTRDDYRGRIVMMIGSDRKGSKYSRVWRKALADALRGDPGFERLTFLGVADTRGVPFLIKGMVKGKMPRDSTYRILLDWKGELAKAYRFDKASATVLLFGPEGAEVHRSGVQDLEPGPMGPILRAVRSLLASVGGAGE